MGDLGESGIINSVTGPRQAVQRYLDVTFLLHEKSLSDHAWPRRYTSHACNHVLFVKQPTCVNVVRKAFANVKTVSEHCQLVT